MKSSLVLAAALSLAVASPVTNPRTAHPPSSHPSTTHSIKLRQIRQPILRRALHPRQEGTILDPLDDGQSFVAQVTIGTEGFNLTLDTGSANLWVVGSNVTCVHGNCNWGKTYNEESGGFQPNGLTWSATYGESNTDSGYTGTADISLAGLSVTAQPIGVADEVTDPNFLGSISGILGMGVASTTKTSTVMQTFISQDVLDEPYFALALSRDESGSGNGGYITLGSLPDLTNPQINASSSYLSGGWEDAGGVNYPGYTTTFPTLQYGKADASVLVINDSVQYTIDNGNSGLDMPTAQADAVASAYEPPATKSNGSYYVDCDAVAPYLAFGIDGGLLTINPADLIGSPSGNGQCNTPIYDNGNANMALGAPFLKNVLAVFDWGNEQLFFYSRPYYDS